MYGPKARSVASGQGGLCTAEYKKEFIRSGVVVVILNGEWVQFTCSRAGTFQQVSNVSGDMKDRASCVLDFDLVL